jgi:SHS2 domain-containing protein
VAGFEALDHTADYAIRAWGGNLGDLIEAAARGMMSLLVDAAGVAPAETVPLTVEAESAEQLVQHCLRELLNLFEDGSVTVAVRASAAESPARAHLEAGVVPITQVRDRLVGEIKAVTYHNLQIRREGGQLTLEVVFDT